MIFSGFLFKIFFIGVWLFTFCLELRLFCKPLKYGRSEFSPISAIDIEKLYNTIILLLLNDLHKYSCSICFAFIYFSTMALCFDLSSLLHYCARLVQGAVTKINWPFTAASLASRLWLGRRQWLHKSGSMRAISTGQVPLHALRSTGLLSYPAPRDRAIPFALSLSLSLSEGTALWKRLHPSVIMRRSRPFGRQRSRDPGPKLVAFLVSRSWNMRLKRPKSCHRKIALEFGVSLLGHIPNWTVS